jgi:hypothetical protein
MPRTPLQYVPSGYRRRLRRQSERAANRIFNPEIQAYRAQKKGVRRQYRKDVRANRGTIAYTQDAISQVPLKGLHGTARKQVAAEMALSSKDVAASLPFLNAEARATRSEAMTGINQDILTARINRSQDAARRFATELDQAGNRFLRDAKDEATDRAEKRKKKRENKVAMKQARRVTMNVLSTEPPPWAPQVIKHYGSVEQAWRAFEERVADEADVDHAQARQAVAALRRRIGRAFHHPESPLREQFRQMDLPGPVRW